MTITAISVTHNSTQVIREALACVCAHDKVTECIVVDNASSDDTAAIIGKDFPQVHVVVNKRNKGFGVACNQALERVKTPYALLLNPDATIDGNAINRLLDVMEHNANAAIISPLLTVGDPSDPRTAPLRFPVLHESKGELATPLSDGVDSVQFISGALMLWRMEHMRQVGFFDPAIFLFYEDDDLCIRTKKAGYDLLLVSGLQATHGIGKSCELTQALEDMKLRSLVWSELYMVKKYRGLLYAKLLALWIAVKHLVSVSCIHGYCWPYFRRADSYYDVVQQRHEKKWPITARTLPKEEAIRVHEGEWLRLARRLSDKELKSREHERRFKGANQFLENSERFILDA